MECFLGVSDGGLKVYSSLSHEGFARGSPTSEALHMALIQDTRVSNSLILHSTHSLPCTNKVPVVQ